MSRSITFSVADDATRDQLIAAIRVDNTTKIKSARTADGNITTTIVGDDELPAIVAKAFNDINVDALPRLKTRDGSKNVSVELQGPNRADVRTALVGLGANSKAGLGYLD